MNIPFSRTFTGMFLTTSFIRIIDLERNGGPEGGFRLNCFLDISPVNQDPYHSDNIALVNAVIRKFRLKARTITTYAIDPALTVRRVEAPAVPREEIIQTLRIMEQEQVPYPMERAVVDAMPFSTVESKGQLPVLMAVLDIDVVKKYNDFIRHTSFKHVGISIRPTVISALLEHTRKIDREELLSVISFGREVTGIHFYRGTQLKFYRDVNIGNSTLFSGAIGSYVIGDQTVEIGPDEVENLRSQFGVPRGPDLFKSGVKGITGAMFLEKIQPTLDKLVIEIGRSIEYFKNDQQIFGISNAFLIGDDLVIEKLADLLSEEIRLSFHPYDPFEDIVSVGLEKMGDKRGLGSQYALLLGTALDAGEGINLLPSRMRFSFSKVVPRLVVVFVGLLYVSFVVGVSLGAIIYNSKVSREISYLNEKVRAMGVVDRSMEAIRKAVEDADSKIASRPKVQGMDVKWPDLFSATGMVLPDDAALDEMTIHFGGQAESSADGQPYRKELLFKGRVRGSDRVMVLQKLVQRMTESEIFLHPTVLSVQQESAKESGDEDFLFFTIAADVVRRGGKTDGNGG